MGIVTLLLGVTSVVAEEPASEAERYAGRAFDAYVGRDYEVLHDLLGEGACGLTKVELFEGLQWDDGTLPVELAQWNLPLPEKWVRALLRTKTTRLAATQTDAEGQRLSVVGIELPLDTIDPPPVDVAELFDRRLSRAISDSITVVDTLDGRRLEWAEPCTAARSGLKWAAQWDLASNIEEDIRCSIEASEVDGKTVVAKGTVHNRSTVVLTGLWFHARIESAGRDTVARASEYIDLPDLEGIRPGETYELVVRQPVGEDAVTCAGFVVLANPPASLKSKKRPQGVGHISP